MTIEQVRCTRYNIYMWSFCQWLAAFLWFSLGTPISFTNKTDHHDITETSRLKVALNTITLTPCDVENLHFCLNHKCLQCEKIIWNYQYKLLLLLLLMVKISSKLDRKWLHEYFVLISGFVQLRSQQGAESLQWFILQKTPKHSNT